LILDTYTTFIYIYMSESDAIISYNDLNIIQNQITDVNQFVNFGVEMSRYIVLFNENE